jgi:hypothetical protein
MAIYQHLTQPRYNSGVNFELKKVALALVVGLLVPVFAVASKPDDTAADAIAVAFVQARKAAHLPELSRIDQNTFGEKVCKHDLRMPSGLIKDVQYETSDPARLSDAARQLATSPDTYKVLHASGLASVLWVRIHLGKSGTRLLLRPTNRPGPASGEFSGSEATQTGSSSTVVNRRYHSLTPAGWFGQV